MALVLEASTRSRRTRHKEGSPGASRSGRSPLTAITFRRGSKQVRGVRNLSGHRRGAGYELERGSERGRRQGKQGTVGEQG